MKPFLIFVGVMLVFVGIAFAAFKAIGGGADYSTLNGEQLFGRLCAQCHGDRGTSPRGLGNSYAGKRDYWTKESLLTYIDDPRRAKVKIPHLAKSRRFMQPIARSVPADARERLVDYVLQLMDDLK